MSSEITFFEPKQYGCKTLGRTKKERALRRDASLFGIDFKELYEGLTPVSFSQIIKILGNNFKEDAIALLSENYSSKKIIRNLKSKYFLSIGSLHNATIKSILKFIKERLDIIKRNEIINQAADALTSSTPSVEEISKSLSALSVKDLKNMSDEELLKLGIEQARSVDINVLSQETDNKLVNLGKFLEENNISGIYSIKGQLLDSLIKKCLVRIRKLENFQVGKQPNIDIESLLLKYIKEIRESLETIDKIKEQATEQDKKYIITVIQNEISSFVKLVKDVVEEICPEKKEIFLAHFKFKISNHFKNIMELATKSVEEN